MNHQAICCKLENVRKHPNADRLQLAQAAGYQVIVGLDAREGDCGALIPEGCALSRDFCLAHKLFRKHPETGEAVGGYLDHNGRIVAMTLRGEMSEGIFLSAKELPAFGLLTIGDTTDSLPGFENFVFKYETVAQIREKHNAGNLADRIHVEGFEEHYETEQLRSNNRKLESQMEAGGQLIITEKLHGTSGRTAKVRVELPLSKLAKFWNRVVPKLQIKPRKEWRVISGTRRTVFLGQPKNEADYRRQIHNYFEPLVQAGETIYYEIVGFDDRSRSIMSKHGTGKLDKDVAKTVAHQLGATTLPPQMVYSYGCDPGGSHLQDHIKLIGQLKVHSEHVSFHMKNYRPAFRVFIYRITQQDENGNIRDLCWDEIIDRCVNLITPGFVDVVPQLFVGVARFSLRYNAICDEDNDCFDLIEMANNLTRGPSTLDPTHIREGVCVRFDKLNSDGTLSAGKAYKHKGFVFCVLEGNAANDPDFVDLEAVA